jgi:hypothetical protein
MGWGKVGKKTVAESHPVNPVHPVCGGEEDRMGWGKVGNGDGGGESSCKSCGSCLRGRRGQDGRRTGWGGERWGMETVAKGHPVTPVHPVCGEGEDRMAG